MSASIKGAVERDVLVADGNPCHIGKVDIVSKSHQQIPLLFVVQFIDGVGKEHQILRCIKPQFSSLLACGLRHRINPPFSREGSDIIIRCLCRLDTKRHTKAMAFVGNHNRSSNIFIIAQVFLPRYSPF